jgi:hypothetical protein
VSTVNDYGGALAGPSAADCLIGPLVRRSERCCSIVSAIRTPRRARTTRRICLLLVLAAACTPLRVAAGSFDDAQVKAAFLLNFLKFVTWPDASADAPLDVVVLGADDVAKALEQAASRQVIGGRPVAVRSVRSAREIGGPPHLLFIGPGERDRLPALLREYEGRPVLTVGDGEGYGRAGAVLNFYVSDTRIRFEANTAAASRAGLQISSHLLRLARIVG